MVESSKASEPQNLGPTEVPQDGTSSEYSGIRYTPLGTDDEIRFLVLLPGTGKLPIECKLVHSYFGNRAEGIEQAYEALSYMWGPLKPAVITVNGEPCVVRQNLLAALMALRYEDRPRTLWVDAICINQNDIPEKSRLVANMNHVYEKAEKVVVWLGDATDDSDYTLQCLYDGVESDDWDALNRRSCMGIQAIFERPYWKRVWIIQEILSARILEIYCGTKMIKEDYIQRVLRRMDIATQYESFNYRAAKENIADIGKQWDKTAGNIILRLRYDWDNTDGNVISRHRFEKSSDENIKRKRTKYTMAQLLSLCVRCGSECFDVRDKIYGLINIAKFDGNMTNISPDYSKTAAQVFMDVFLAQFFKTELNYSHFFDSEARNRESRMNLNIRQIQSVLGNPLWDAETNQYFDLNSICTPNQRQWMTEARLEEFVQARGTIVWCESIITQAPKDPVSFDSTVYGYVPLLDNPPPYPEDFPKIERTLSSVCISYYHSTDLIGRSYTLNPQTNGYMPLDNDPSISVILSRTSSASCKIFSTIDGYIGFTTSEVQPDDLLLIIQTKQYIVIRLDKETTNVKIIGRAVILRQGHDEKAFNDVTYRSKEETVHYRLTTGGTKSFIMDAATVFLLQR